MGRLRLPGTGTSTGPHIRAGRLSTGGVIGYLNYKGLLGPPN